MKKLLVGTVIGVLMMAVHICWAGIPFLMNYQGMLTDDEGNPLNGDHNLTFKIYSLSSGGSALWTETHTGTQVQDGLFNVILGSLSLLPSSVFEDTVRYLGITVGSDPELSPRIRLTSMPYAYRALVADSAAVVGSGTGGAGGWVDDGDVVRLETSADKVGVGTDNPLDKMVVVDGSMEGTLCYYYYSPGLYYIYSGVKGAYGEDVEGFLGRRYYSTIGGNSYYGVYGSATTSGRNYGVYGLASGGSTNWAGYFDGDVHASGKVGIGTATPGVKLQIDGGGDVKDHTQNTGYLIIGPSTGQHIAIDNNEIMAKASGTTAGDLYIQASDDARTIIYGKVGIGTESPSEKLDVEGNIDVSNNQIKNYYGFPKPNYDSGWQPISAGATLTFTHNIGGNVDNYVVDLWFHNNTDGRHNFSIGGAEYGDHDYEYGAYWTNLTNSQIKVYRLAKDVYVGQVTVRIWAYN